MRARFAPSQVMAPRKPTDLFLFAAPQSDEMRSPPARLLRGSPRGRSSTTASQKFSTPLKQPPLRYGSHDALRQAGLSVTDWALFYRANIEVGERL